MGALVHPGAGQAQEGRQGAGFTRLNQVVEREDTPSIRGMVNKVPHLLEIV